MISRGEALSKEQVFQYHQQGWLFYPVHQHNNLNPTYPLTPSNDRCINMEIVFQFHILPHSYRSHARVYYEHRNKKERNL